MKIYFEDGELKNVLNEIEGNIDLILDAKYGFSYCDDALYTLKQIIPDAVVYTNVITSLRSEYAWNRELNAHEIFIRNKDGVFTRIDKLTSKELREGHNIMRMYIAGAFGNFEEETRKETNS